MSSELTSATGEGSRGRDEVADRAAVLRYLCTLTRGDRVVAEDLCQETFLRFWRSRRGSLPAAGEVRPLLLGYARNVWINHLERERVRARPAQRTPSIAGEVVEAATPDLERGEIAAAVRAAILDLPDPLREAFVLHRHEGLTYREIAAHLGVSQRTVAARIRGAIDRLRDELRDHL